MIGRAESVEVYLDREFGMDADVLRLRCSIANQRFYLRRDGEIVNVPEEWAFLDNDGIILPRGTREAMIRELVDHADAGTVKELRDALDRAESRVDRLIDKALQ